MSQMMEKIGDVSGFLKNHSFSKRCIHGAVKAGDPSREREGIRWLSKAMVFYFVSGFSKSF